MNIENTYQLVGFCSSTSSAGTIWHETCGQLRSTVSLRSVSWVRPAQCAGLSYAQGDEGEESEGGRQRALGFLAGVFDKTKQNLNRAQIAVSWRRVLILQLHCGLHSWPQSTLDFGEFPVIAFTTGR